jgi:hypothetical protein
MEDINITATEARKISEESIDSANKTRLASIENSIKVACKINKFNIYEYSDLSISVINHLKNRGFQVENLSSQREGTCFNISW